MIWLVSVGPSPEAIAFVLSTSCTSLSILNLEVFAMFLNELKSFDLSMLSGEAAVPLHCLSQ